MRELLREQIEALLEEAGGLLEEQSGRLRELRDRLERQRLPGPAGIADSVAAETHGFSERLAQMDGDDVLEAARALAQRRGPWVFAAGGATAGLLLWGGLRAAASRAAHEPAPAGELKAGDGPDGPAAGSGQPAPDDPAA